MKEAPIVKLAREIATEAHSGQTRRDKITPYIHHPQAVAERVGAANLKAIAWLHDVLEDTGETPDSLLKKGVPQEIIDDLVVLTKKECEKYEDYISRIRSYGGNAIAIKVADICANMADSPTKYQMKKYSRALLVLLD